MFWAKAPLATAKIKSPVTSIFIFHVSVLIIFLIGNYF